MFRKRRLVEVPQNIEWSDRANPFLTAESEGYTGNSLLRRADIIARENAAFLRKEYNDNGGIIIGYHGTTTPRAERIGQVGFDNRTNEEGSTGVSAWDRVVGHRALFFAIERSKMEGLSDGGRVIKVRMHNPEYDHKHARLEWLADARHTEVLDIFTPHEMQHEIGRLGIEGSRTDQ